MIQGPNRNTNTSAVIMAPPVRTVRYRNTLKIVSVPERSASQ